MHTSLLIHSFDNKNERNRGMQTRDLPIVGFHCRSLVPKINGLRTSKYGNEFSKNIPLSTTLVGSDAISSRWLAVAVMSSGRRVSYIPPGERKSGLIPLLFIHNLVSNHNVLHKIIRNDK